MTKSANPIGLRADEWRARCDLAALYHAVDHLGWTDMIETHLSMRVPNEPDRFLINNYGDLFHEIVASRLIKVGINGSTSELNGKVNPAGAAIHSAVYRARPDVNCVIHTHTPAGVGISVLERGLRPISQDALAVWDEIVYHEYSALASQEECDALGADCQKGDCLVLRNHGLLCIGRTIPATLHNLYRFEAACRTEVLARSLDEQPKPIGTRAIEDYLARKRKDRSSPEFGVMFWNTMKRVIKSKGLDYEV